MYYVLIQLDLWSFVHFGGTLLLAVIFQNPMIAIVLNFCWDLLDLIYSSLFPTPNKTLSRIFDHRGTSYMDVFLGGLAGIIYSLIWRPQFISGTILLTVFATVVALAFLFKKENWYINFTQE